MEKFDRMVVVGLDGLDYQKIQQFDCDTLTGMETFGHLDTEGIKLSTPMLWASMITGERPETHGIDTMLTFRGEKVRKMDKYVLGFLEKLGMSALHLRRALYYYLFDSSIFVPDKDFMEVDSIFEKVADSVALDVPGYSEYPYIAGKSFVAKSNRKRPPVSKQRVLRDCEAEYSYRKDQLFDHLNEHKLVMQHFHYPDWHQHMFFNNEEKDRELYEKMDGFAEQILEEVDDDTLVVFCSDHGLEGGGHREEAFYATNAELEDPVKITELLFSCLEQLDYAEEEEKIEEIEI
ncbi:MAG: alkaline phosphatase family protein [Candidatus Nanohaloarchaea archaeon]